MTAPELAVVPAATRDEATARAERIRAGMRSFTEMLADIEMAFASRDWVALGYRSWDEYTNAEFSEGRLRLSAAQREEGIRRLRLSNMSVRSIGSSLGLARNTVRHEVRRQVGQPDPPESDVREGVNPTLVDTGMERDNLTHGSVIDEAHAEHVAPAPRPPSVRGADGKSYRPAPRPPTSPQRAALPPQFQAASSELSRVIARFERLQQDDRYRANRAAITTQCLPEIRRAAEVLHGLLSDLGHENGGPQ